LGDLASGIGSRVEPTGDRRETKETNLEEGKGGGRKEEDIRGEKLEEPSFGVSLGELIHRK